MVVIIHVKKIVKNVKIHLTIIPIYYLKLFLIKISDTLVKELNVFGAYAEFMFLIIFSTKFVKIHQTNFGWNISFFLQRAINSFMNL